jgi:hypothetical protein
MVRRQFAFVLIAALLSLGTGLSAGDAKPPRVEFIEPDGAGPDFKIQGEYSGEVTTTEGKKKLGAQIVACGDGTFHSEFFPGGLPGDGWDEKAKLEKTPAKQGTIPVDSKTEGDKTVINGVYSATIVGDTMTGTTDKGDKFELKRVMRESPTLGAKPPAGALVLFDGTNVDEWNGKMDERKLLQYGCTTKKKFGDFTFHIEFRQPFMPNSRGQGRGNSGLYLQDRYECQMLDSFGLAGDNNECGGFYTLANPRINMAFPPLSWQTYDIEFEAAKFDEAGKKIKNAIATVKHNGVLIHDKFELQKPTGGGKPETKEGGQFQLQNHGDKVFYRNIWVVEKK